MRGVGDSLDYEFYSNWLLKAAIYFSSALYIGIGFLFFLICRKHYKRHKRKRLSALVARLLVQYCENSDLIHQRKIVAQLRRLSKDNYLNFLLLWTWLVQQANEERLVIYEEITNQINLYFGIENALKSSNLDSKTIALKVIGSAGLSKFTSEVERLSQDRLVAKFACHALCKLQKTKAISLLLSAYKKGYISNTELLICFSEISLPEIEDWESQHPDVHLPKIVLNYLWSNVNA